MGASAWISSTITVRVVESILRPDSEPSSTYSDSGVVTRMCGGVLSIAALCLLALFVFHEVRLRIALHRHPREVDHTDKERRGF